MTEPVKLYGTTYHYRDPEKRREYMKLYMRRWRAKKKQPEDARS